MEAPQYYESGRSAPFVTENHHPLDNKTAAGGSIDHFIVEDLLDFSNDDAPITDGFDSLTGNSSTESSNVTAVDSCNSSSLAGDLVCRNFTTDVHFSTELCVPYDDLAELEWLSNFEEESFSSEDLQKLQLISGMNARADESSKTREFQHGPNRNATAFHTDMSVPAKARSKRSRAAPCIWNSRLPVLSPTTSSSETDVFLPTTQNSSQSAPRRKEGPDGGIGEGRRCVHCATDKTPQWRTGPMGPKTLCNACGVRYKSGRLVPEYRPAASPTFVLTKHSNSHRKVMELRRQKEMQRAHPHQEQFYHHHQNMVYDVSNGDDYLIHQQVGPNFRQLI